MCHKHFLTYQLKPAGRQLFAGGFSLWLCHNSKSPLVIPWAQIQLYVFMITQRLAKPEALWCAKGQAKLCLIYLFIYCEFSRDRGDWIYLFIYFWAWIVWVMTLGLQRVVLQLWVPSTDGDYEALMLCIVAKTDWRMCEATG